jgi:hypothetical protein
VLNNVRKKLKIPPKKYLEEEEFFKFFCASMIFLRQKVYFSRLMQVYVGLIMLPSFLSFPLIRSGE